MNTYDKNKDFLIKLLRDFVTKFEGNFNNMNMSEIRDFLMKSQREYVNMCTTGANIKATAGF